MLEDTRFAIKRGHGIDAARVVALLQAKTVIVVDVTSRITSRRSFDFRGDNDIAWNHAVDYMVRHLHN